MPAPFFMFLRTAHILPKVTSYDATQSKPAKVLQDLIDQGNSEGYRRQLLEYQEQGLKFRLTDMKVYETRDEGEKIKVRIAIQVKGSSISWYFWVPNGKDQYPQEFRDQLYNAAAECHKKVKNGCDLYHRGSNAYHVKTMHHIEREAAHNHNHYRVGGGQPVTPTDFQEHMQAFKQHEVHDLFFEAGEVDYLCERFNHYYQKWTAPSSPRYSSMVDYLWQMVPAALTGKKPSSPKERYEALPSQQLDRADYIELYIFGVAQEPCRLNVAELKVDFDRARRSIEQMMSDARAADDSAAVDKCQRELAAIAQEYQQLLKFRQVGGSRGMAAELANTRQIPGSKYPVVATTVVQMGALTIDGKIPDWAVRARQEVEAMKASIERQHQASHPQDNTSVAQHASTMYGEKGRAPQQRDDGKELQQQQQQLDKK